MPALLKEMLPAADSEEESCHLLGCLMEKDLRIISWLTTYNKLKREATGQRSREGELKVYILLNVLLPLTEPL